MRKGLSEIDRIEWIGINWIEITCQEDPERTFLSWGARTPDEAARAARDWDATVEERKEGLQKLSEQKKSEAA